VISIYVTKRFGSILLILPVLVLILADSGDVGVYQNAIVSVAFAFSSMFISTYITSTLGSKQALCLGLCMYTIFVICSCMQHLFRGYSAIVSNSSAIVGALVAGIGGGVLWTSEGVYFAQASKSYSVLTGEDVSLNTSYFANIFAFIFLVGEILLKAMSTMFVTWLNFKQIWLYSIYAIVCILSSMNMFIVIDYSERSPNATSLSQSGCGEKALGSMRLFQTDAKMKYMVLMPTAFGMTSAFLNTFVGGHVIPVALSPDNDESLSIEYLVGAMSASAAASASLVNFLLATTRLSEVKMENLMVVGALSYATIPFIFILLPRFSEWNLPMILCVYVIMGVGRAMYEGPLQSAFALFFPEAKQKEGAFANKALSYGVGSAVGFLLNIYLKCSDEGTYCIRYNNNSLHYVLPLEILLIIFACLGFAGFWVAHIMHRSCQRFQLCTEDEDEIVVTEFEGTLLEEEGEKDYSLEC